MKAVYYENKKREKPVEKFINELDDKTKGKVLARIEFLEERWRELGRPYVDKIDADLYELRVQFSSNNVRIIYAYMFRDFIVLLHGILKKRREIPKNAILKAKKRMIDFRDRCKEGTVKLK